LIALNASLHIEIVVDTQKSLLKACIDDRFASKIAKNTNVEIKHCCYTLLKNIGVKSVVDTSFLYRFHCVMHSLYAVTKDLELSSSL